MIPHDSVKVCRAVFSNHLNYHGYEKKIYFM